MKYFLLLLLFSISTVIVNGQARVTSTGIAIQGIARNGSSAVANASVSIDTDIYFVTGNTTTSIKTGTGSVTTDSYGIFSYVVPITNTEFLKISNKETYLKIKANGVVFADEKLNAVPYAIHAQNGVPTGSIMPFSSDAIPAGWLLCDGSTIPTGVEYDALRNLFSNNKVPNLKGMFLRATGSQSSYTGPSLLQYQSDAIKSHLHAITISGYTSTDGNHTHSGKRNAGGSLSMGPVVNFDYGNNGDEKYLYDWTSTPVPEVSANNGIYNIDNTGSHYHNITGTGTSGSYSDGISETRPANYGVNYIIKI
jgi:Phage Tail Collar Domain